jgi:hypothetical protein
MRTGWNHPLGGSLDQLLDPGCVIGGLAAGNACQHALARQRAFDENHFSIAAGNAARLEIQGLYVQYFLCHVRVSKSGNLKF